MLLVKLLVLLILGFVIVSLFSGLYFLVKDKGQTNRTVNALTIRIGLSILAIVVVVIAGVTGVIEMNPNPIHEQAGVPSSDQTSDPSGDPAADGQGEAATGEVGGGRRRSTD